MNKFPQRLRELREEKGLSQRGLAKAVQQSQSAITHWENGKNSPSADVIIAFAIFFNVSSDYLLGLED